MTQLTAPPFFAKASDIPPSWLHESFRRASERERTAEVIKLHVGEPAFGPPDRVAAELAAAALHGRTRYVDVQGLLELRERLTDKLALINGVDTHPDRLFVSPGSCQGLFALMRSLAEPGAEILMPEIHWPVHLQQALLAGLRVRFYGLDGNYAPDVDSLRDTSGPASRILLLNSPSNPTGAVVDLARQAEILDLARARGWHVVSDEAYEDFAFTGPHVSIASLERDVPLADRIVTSVFTFSKGLAMTGYRLGYTAVSRPDVADAMRMVQESNIIAPSAPIQYAGLVALDTDQELARNREYVRTNRDTVLPALVDAGLLARLPDGGWYAMADVCCTGLSGEAFADLLARTADVVVVPGSGFSQQPEYGPDGSLRPLRPGGVASGLIRLAFCVEREQLRSGVARIIALADQLRHDADAGQSR